MSSRLNLNISESSIEIKQIDGVTNSIGRVQFSLTINGTTHQCTAHVLERFQYPFLLGLDIGKLFDLQINMQDHKVSLSTCASKARICFTVSSPNSIQQVLIKHKGIFSANPTDIGQIKSVKHYIRTSKEHPPIHLRAYRRSHVERQEIQTQVEDLLQKGLIKKSTSPWAFPVTLASKKDGTKRLCIDFRKLNAITIDDKQPIPRISDVIDNLLNAKVFTTLDISCGFWHIPMNETDIEKTAFVTNDGHYEWLTMPFGLKNAPATFQRTIQQILGPLLWKGCMNYLDDIVVYSTNEAEHLNLLDNVLTILHDSGIKLKYKKCTFMQPRIEYLGLMIGNNQIQPTERQLSAVAAFPVPNNAKEVQRFLGLANYFRRFIPKFADIALPLTQLLRKENEFHWSDSQQQCFDTLKMHLTSKPVLVIYDPEKEIELHTDASKTGIGAILIQKEDKQKHVICYYSRRLNKHEENYSTSELECLAVVDSVDHFHVYLHGIRFTIVTDHSSLQWFYQIKNPSGRLFRWSIRLSTYNYKIVHRKGALHQHVDALSRAPVEPPTDKSFKAEAIQLPFSRDEIIKSQASLSPQSKQFKYKDIVYIKQKGVRKIVLPKELQLNAIQHFHDQHGHPGALKTSKLINRHYHWHDMHKDISKYTKSCHPCQIVKIPTHAPYGELLPLPTPIQPLELLGIDTIVMGSSAASTKAKYIQVIVDHHSRYLWTYATPTNTAACMVNIVSNLIQAVGPPKAILTDNFKSFTGKEFNRFLKSHNIRHKLSSSYHPQTCGMVEKHNHNITNRLRIASQEFPKLKWSTLLPTVTKQYNNTIHESTGYTPLFLLFGITNEENPISLDKARKLAFNKSEHLKQLNKQRFDLNREFITFKIGDLVLRKIASNRPDLKKLSPRYDGPFEIISPITSNSYRVKDINKESVTNIHVSQLKPYYESNFPGEKFS